MHELTLLYGVAEKVEQVVKENGLERIDAVVIEVGEATTVVPAFLLDGYSVISNDYDFLRGSELIIDTIPAAGRCRNCGREYLLTPCRGICPDCGSTEKDVTAGTDFFIKEVRIMET